MTTELIKPETKHQIAMGSHGLRLASLDDAWRFAQYVVKSRLAPQQFSQPEQVLIAMQHGAEVGLSPMQSLQSIAVINGRPSLWGDALPALVWSSGKCEMIREWVDGEGESMVAYCETKRVGQPNTKTTTFSVGDAKKAGLWGKTGPWQSYPKRMLQMRARAYNFRDQFADALKGLAVAEEMQDVPAEPTGGRQLSMADFDRDEETEPTPATDVQPDAETEPTHDGDKLAADLAACKTTEDVIFVQAQHGDAVPEVVQACADRIKELMKPPKRGKLIPDDEITY